MNTCISADRKKRKQGTKVPLSMDISLYNDEDHETRQVRQLHERIQRLDLIDRALVMMWLEGMNYDEIAEVIGISVKNVGVKLVRIKEKLKQK
jgi:RNA polymerase sigma-70 factor (ECF subfamily)